MYEIIKSVIQSKDFKLSEILKKSTPYGLRMT